jgi:hypothetical protein
MRRTARNLTAVAALGMGALALLSPGCVGYNVYPAMPGEHAFNDPNSPILYKIMAESIRWTNYRYPETDLAPAMPEGPAPEPVPWARPEPKKPAADTPPRFAVSLGPGLKREVYQRAVEIIGPGAVPLTPENAHLPTYYIARVAISGDSATVDLFKPVTGMTGPGGKPVHQAITLNLRGGLKPWTVTSHKVWTIGALEVPEPSYLPEPGHVSGPTQAAPPVPAAAPAPAPAPAPAAAEPAKPAGSAEKNGDASQPPAPGGSAPKDP